MSTYLADTAEDLTVDGPSATFTYRRVGPTGGVPLVLLNRVRGTLGWWDPTFLDHRAADRDVIVFDNIGTGYTAGTPRDSVEGLADGAVDFIEALVRATMTKPEVTGDDEVFLFFPETDTGRAAGYEHLARVARRLATGLLEVSEAALVTAGHAVRSGRRGHAHAGGPGLPGGNHRRRDRRRAGRVRSTPSDRRGVCEADTLRPPTRLTRSPDPRHTRPVHRSAQKIGRTVR
ncbi:alpha/beta fold hydrolase [Streptomyces sp. NPDC003011]